MKGEERIFWMGMGMWLLFMLPLIIAAWREM
jgi:hypothetical protein